MKAVIESIYSPCNGVVEEVLINEKSYVYEWEKLLIIRNNKGILEEAAVGISGNVLSVDVVVGQEVDTNTVLCKVEDDLLITGCE
ncbi:MULTISPECIES: hypothetical protein [unclassified Bacillus (in: firmicutes)]|uniref:Lipoyl-binding domain-containing protein n=1 Tax=Bacillus bruguierae TaxID=3127667 RepID=A0ABU8FKU0_9BACI|nr:MULTISPECIES: hypothetical protein [unclassified Bacillus (in: firmicutes)]SFJ86061.1 hypothetical protein SAMN04488574_13131 [Bacillus sp. 71mf]SFT06039.1 hypothetical protein SAMN04488145_10929 [Bacillus sp. 103mf]